MDRPVTKVSFALDLELHDAVTALKLKTPGSNQTTILNSLIADGLTCRSELERARHREDYLLLKLLFMMRYLAGSRGEEVLEEIDQRFSDDLPDIRDLIFEEGMDYVRR